MKKKSILCLLIAFSLLIMPGNNITENRGIKESTEIVIGDTVLETSDYNKSDICISRTCQEGPAIIFLDCTVYMHDSGFYTQIDEVLGTNMYIASSTDTTLENVDSYWSVPNDVFPTAEVNFYGSGVITGKSINKPVNMSGSFYSYSSGH